MIRSVKGEDWAGLDPLWQTFDKSHYSQSDYYFHPPSETERLERHRRYLDREESLYLLAEEKGLIVGFICGVRRTTAGVCLLQERKILELHGIAINQETRGQGWASMLIQKAREIAREEGLSDLEVAIWDFNLPIQRIVTDLGFKRISGKYALKTK
jgi:ribosomal protein S18 acetylase RimI-like enzyme